MCLEIGTREQIASRRDIVDIEVFLKNQVRKCDGFNRMDSGSEREGFRLQKSDIDIMYWQLDYQVIWEFSQSKCFNLNKQVLFLADSSKSPPGFTLLWLPYGRANEDIFSVCVTMRKRSYISSSKYIEMKSKSYIPGSETKGPSRRGKLHDVEYDENGCLSLIFCLLLPPHG